MASARSTGGFASWAVLWLAAGCGPAPAPRAPSPPPPAEQPVSIAAPSRAEPEQPQELQQASDPPKSAAQFDVGPELGRAPRQSHTGAVHVLRLGVALKKKWQARVGRTTFRTTMALVGDKLVIGTHGRTLKGKNERDDGVYVLDAKTGKRVQLIRTPGHGDLDVGGVAIDGQDVVFSTDNSQIIKASLGGKIEWKARAKGKVRPAPALADLDGDGDLDVVVGDESGMLRALDGKTGKRLWGVATGGNDYGAKGFIGAAAVADLDGDGHPDVVAGARDGILAAYRGSDGGVLWQLANSSGIHASPIVADFDQDGSPEVLAAWSYGDVVIADGKTGEKRWAALLQQDGGGIEGLFGTPTPLPGSPGVLIAPTSWWGAKEDGIIGVGVDERRFKSFEGRVSASAVVTDLANDGKLEAIIGTEKGKLLALTADGGRAVLAKLGGPIEAPAMLADTDGNGTYELLVASNDGKLTCFETGSKAKPFISRFRGESLHNTGVIGATKLGWQSQRRAGAQATGRGGASRGNIRIDYLRCCKALTEKATRAPTPQNKRYLQAASVCTTLAGLNTDRGKALSSIKAVLRGADVPAECR